MFGNLFAGMNVSNMHVNFNVNGMDQNRMQQMNPVRNNYGNIIGPPPSSCLMLENKKDTRTRFIFDKIFILESYNLVIGDEYDKDVKPKGEFDTLNDRYLITEYAGQHGYKQPNILGEIVNRKDKNPPIVTLLDYENEEDKNVVDQIIFNTVLLTRHYKHNNFFLVLETSGSVEPGEPFFVTFSKKKALFKKEIFSITV